MKAFLDFRTLESRIYASFTLMIFAIILIIQFISYGYTNSRVSAAMMDNSRALLHQMADQLGSYVGSMDRIAGVLAEDESVVELLRVSDGQSHAVREITQRLHSYVEVREDISHMLLVDAHGNFVAADDSTIKLNPETAVGNKPWFSHALAQPSTTQLFPAYVQNLFAGSYTWVVSMSRGIVDPESGLLLGVLLIDLKFTRIRELSQAMVTGEKGYNFILDRYGNYIYHPFQQLIYSGIKTEPLSNLQLHLSADDERQLDVGPLHYQLVEEPDSGWILVGVVNDADIRSTWQYSRILYSLFGLVFFLIIGIISNSISRGITKPLRRLQGVMQSVDTGNFRQVGEIRATFEIRELAREYDLMVEKIQDLVRINNRDQELKRKSDLKALQAQINPHFLYNTLDSIIWMSEMGDNKAAIQMTSALSKLFRISISKGKEFILIEDEIQHVESYLKIQKMRYKEKFDFSIDVDPDLYLERCLKILLQPIVENAIYHGIKELDDKGVIAISVNYRQRDICFEVEDNGQGMDQGELRDLRAWLDRPVVSPQTHDDLGMQGRGEQVGESEPGTDMVTRSGGRRFGTGVKNVHERVKLYYGPEYGVAISSKLGVGTLVTVTIPLTAEGEVI